MAKRNDNFFKEKKPWSEVKDELLGCYFKPYVSKILHTYKPLIYVDCFAGKGKFEDGSKGSPLIALEIIDECKHRTTMESINIATYFIDLNYADDLRNNLSNYPHINIISGKYEDNIEELLKSKNGCNVFLYIDPYGIKALQCSMFEKLAYSNFNSIELLINMNSFGFVREACNALGIDYNDVDSDVFDDLVEYYPTKMSTSEKSKAQLTEIAGGDYWIKIVEGYKAKNYDGYQAEKMFSEQYCKQLMKSYKYVLNMPLRIKQGQRPKYRMVHATNHEDGCLLMVDNICNRWQALQDIQLKGQMMLWSQDVENQIVSDEIIEEKFASHMLRYKEHTSINIILAEFFIKYGALCSTGDVKKAIKKLENNDMINIIRSPATTDKGKKSTFLTFDSKKKAWIRSCI